MTSTYTLTIEAACPVDPSVVDEYETTIWFEGMLLVELIFEVVAELTRKPIYQEMLTQALADRFHAQVETLGEHSGVATRCCCS